MADTTNTMRPGGLRRRRAGFLLLAVLLLVVGVLVALPARNTPDSRWTAPADVTQRPDVPRDRATVTQPTAGDEAATLPRRSPRLVLVGRVVDERSVPVERAIVSLESLDPLTTAETDADGRFRFAVTAGADANHPHWRVRARDEQGRGGFALGFLAERSDPETGDRVLNVGTIVLEPACALVVRVVDAGGPVADATVTVVRAGSALAVARTGVDGVARIDGVPAGVCDVRAYAKGHGRAAAHRVRPSTLREPVELVLVARDVRVTVVRARDDAPIAGVQLVVTEQGMNFGGERLLFPPPIDPLPTDAQGRTVLHDVGDDGFDVGPPTRDAGVRVSPSDCDVTIRCPEARTVRWRLVAGEVVPPPDGTVFRLFLPPSPVCFRVPESVRVAGGELCFATTEERVTAFAISEDGAISTFLWGKKERERGEDAACNRTRRISVRITESDGDPARGVRVRASPFPAGNEVVTDADGRATLGPFPCEDTLTSVLVSARMPDGHVPEEVTLGIIDLKRGDATIDCVLPVVHQVLVRLRVDGVPMLPGGWNLRVGDGQGQSVIREDPDRGEALVAVVAAADAVESEGNITAPGIALQWVTIRWSSGGPAQLEIDLVSTCTIQARGVRPGEFVQLQTWSDRRSAWENVFHAPGAHGGWESILADENGLIVVSGLAPGRYRLQDMSGRATQEVVLAAGSTSEEIQIASSVALVSGRIEMPGGVAFDRRARVVVLIDGVARPDEGSGAGLSAGQVQIDSHGTFSTYVPTDARVELRATHPEFIADPATGTVEVHPPCDPVTLRLTRGSAAVAQLPELRGPGAPTSARVVLSPLESGAELELNAGVNDGELRFGGFAPGAWRIFVDVAGFAPATLDRVELGPSLTSLGLVDLSRGRTLRVSIAGRVNSPGSVLVAARSSTKPGYLRRATFALGEPLLLRGLAPGRFDVDVQILGLHPRVVSRSVEIGDGDADLSVD